MDARTVHELAQGRAATTEGVAVAVDHAAHLATVNVNGVTYEMPWFGDAPLVNGRVRVLTLGRQARVCSPIHGAAMGTVVTSSGGFSTVTGDDGVTYRYRHFGDAPANGEQVRLDHAAELALVGVYAAAPVPPPPPPPVEPDLPPPPPPTVRSATFTPIWSGSWWNGVFNTPAVQTSYTRVAGYGYGTAIADTIPNSATITRAELHLIIDWDNSGSSIDAAMGIHGHVGQPATLAPGDLSGVVPVPRGATRIVLPYAVADTLRTGAARGLAFYPDNRWWRQYGAAPNSGRVFMEWR